MLFDKVKNLGWLNTVTVYGLIWYKYGVFTVVYDQIRTVYMPYFIVNQVGSLRPYLRRVGYGMFTAKIRWPYVAVYGRILVVYVPYWHRIRYYVSSYLHAPFVRRGATAFLSPPAQIEKIISIFYIDTYHWNCCSD
jgi:hypothetical protein